MSTLHVGVYLLYRTKVSISEAKCAYSFLVMAMRLSKNVATKNERTRGMRTYLLANARNNVT